MMKFIHTFVLIGLSPGLAFCGEWTVGAHDTNSQIASPFVVVQKVVSNNLLIAQSSEEVPAPTQKIEPQPASETVAPDAPVGKASSGASDEKIANSVAVTEVQFKTARLGPIKRNDGLRFEYGELRGIAAKIRGTLLNSGITVIQARSRAAKPNDDDSYLELQNRIKEGDYGQAQYVLYGVASQLDVSSRKDSIFGSNATSAVAELTIAVDFSMVDTTSGEVIASFVARGSGRDMRLVGPLDAPFQPDRARMIQSAQDLLAADVENKLREQGILRVSESPDAPASNNSRLPRKVLGEDLKTLKVYR